MNPRLYTTQLTVPAGTPIANPVSAPIVLDDLNLDLVEIIIPNGHVQLTGVAVTSGGSPVVPYLVGTWITGNDDRIPFPFDAEVTANGLVCAGYNLDIYPHTFYFRWFLSDLKKSPVQIVSPQGTVTVNPDTIGAVNDLVGVVQ